ncbi:hypothetical protein [Desulfocurvus sp. DL9XJH121]
MAIIVDLRARARGLEKDLDELRRDAVLRQSRVKALAVEVEELERVRREEREAALAADSPRRTVMDVLQASGRISAEDVLRARTFMSGGGGAQSEEQALIILGVITEEDVAVASRELA